MLLFLCLIKSGRFFLVLVSGIRRRRRQPGRQKSNRFIKQNNNFARASRFFVHFFTVLARLRSENKPRRISFSLSKLECGPQEINSREIRLRLPFSANWKKRDKD